MIPARISGRVAVGFVALVAALAITAAPASAKIVHHLEGSFNGSDALGGPFGGLLMSDAVDQSSGDVYVLESNFFELGKGVIDKFDEGGAYAGVQIAGTPIPGQETFALTLSSGVAVDSSLGVNSGDVYVADTEHGVVDRFSSAGAFLCQLSGEETPSSSECDLTGSKLEGAISPAGVAVDAVGDLYVAENAHAVIDEFAPSGEYVSQIKDSHLTSEMGTIAVDSSGDVYVTNLCFFGGCETRNVLKFDSTGAFVSVLDSRGERGSEVSGVGVDPVTNHVYVGGSKDFQSDITEYEPSGTMLTVFATGQVGFFGLAVDGASGRIYAAQAPLFSGGAVDIFGPDVVVPTVTTSSATNVQQTSATLNGHVDPDAAHGGGEVTECEFEYVTDRQFQEHPENPYEGATAASCVPAAPYSTAMDVSADIAVTPSTTYHFRLTAANANGPDEGNDVAVTTFGPAAVDGESVAASATNATVKTQINPFGYDTTCQVQYVDEAGFQSSGYAGAKTLPCAPAELSAGFGDQSAGATLTGLAVDTTYHLRFVATNQAGETLGADQTFATFGIKSFKLEVLDKEGAPYTQAGGHPYKLITSFELNTREGKELTTANLRDVQTELPPGLVGNPTAIVKCTRAEMTSNRCGGASQVGLLTVDSSGGSSLIPLYNLVPPPGVPVEFGGSVQELNLYIDINVRSGGDYGVTANVLNAIIPVGVTGATAEIWGVPADPSHDPERECPIPREGGYFEERAPCSANALAEPFLTDPDSCTPETARLRVDSWQAPGSFVEAKSTLPAFTGCDRFRFAPWISVLPDTSAADSPSGILVKLHVPQDESVEGVATPSLRDALVTLPLGVTLNPAAANGLQACSPAQIGLENADEPTCPDASKVGSVEIETPLLSDTFKGSVYLAQQNNNPFGSMLALYVTAEADGVLIKVAGKVEADPLTGQLTSTFTDTPQLPFSDFRLHFFGGPRAPLVTPKVCGAYTTTSTLTPWSAPESGPPAIQSSTFQISTAPGGGPCAAPGFAPSFTAGTTSNQAGGFSPFTFTMSRSDGEQNLGTVSTTMPPGITGMLSNVPLCGEAQASEGACPAASQIGHVTVGVGAGPYPLQTPEPGKPQDPVFLTGPYRGAPFGLSIVVPAEAGPFNLDENGKPVVVRAAINVDPLTAQVTVTSDPIPQMLQGIPLDVRVVNVTIDRPEFIINPTSCERMQIVGNITSGQGATASLTAPFQVTNCAALGFKPLFKVSTSGRTSRANGASLDAKLTYPKAPWGSQANIRSVKVDLPKQLPSRLTTLQKACPDSTFNQNPASCPAGSRVGTATATTPIIPVSLSGPAYFVSHGGAKFPELVIVLSGYGVTVQLHGETFISSAGITSSTFRTIPDVPIGMFELKLPQGKGSALAANGNLCTSKLKMPTTFTAQNGLVIKQATPITAAGCVKHKKPKKKTKKAGKHNAKAKKRN